MRKKVLSLMLALGLCLGLLPTAALAAEVTVTEAVPCKYEQVTPFSEGLAAVLDENGKWGFIDTTGKEVIPCKYRSANGFSEGFAAVADDNWKWGFIDTAGNEVVPFQYKSVENFSEGLAVVSVSDGHNVYQYGYIDTTGREVIPCQYNHAWSFSEGLAAVDNKPHVMGTNPGGSGYYGMCGYIDATGKEVISCRYGAVEAFSEGLAAVKDKDSNKWGFVDKTGTEVIPCKYNSVGNFSEGFVAVADENWKYGYIDKSGNEIVPCKYNVARPFSGGLAAVGMETDKFYDGVIYKWGFIDTTGAEVIPCQYEDSQYGGPTFSEGLAKVAEILDNFGRGKWGFIDRSGQKVIPMQYSKAGRFSNGLVDVQDQDTGKWGYIDRYGNKVVPCRYESAQIFSEGFAAVCLNGKWGFLAVGTASAPSPATAYASTQTVLVDGKPVVFNAYALKDENGNDTNYVKLRDVAQILNGSAAQFEVGWDGAISITTNAAYTPNGSELIQNFTGNQSYTVNSSPVKVNGVEAGLEAITLTDASGGGFTYFKLRDLGTALGFTVDWNAADGIIIKTK